MRYAERTADAAMARLDAKDFPPTKVEALVAAADLVWRMASADGDSHMSVRNDLMATLGKAFADLKEK